MEKSKDPKYNLNRLKTSTKQPPNVVEVEKNVLGAIMLDNQSAPKAFEILKPNHFYSPKHGIIYSAMISLFESNEPIDSISVYQELKVSGKSDEIGGAVYISQLVSDTSSAANIEYNSRLILEKWILRELINTSINIADSAYDETEDVLDLMDIAESKIFQIAEESLKESYKSMDKAVREAIEHIEAIHSKNISSFSVPSGFVQLDDLLGGFQKSDLIIIAARPSMGKTAFALSAMRNAAVDHNVPIAIFSLEMATIQLVTRLICAEARINAHKVRTGKFNAEEGPRISRTAHKLSTAPIYIDDTPAQTVLEIRAKARRLKAEKNIGMIIIDYLQLMSSNTRMESREREISTISRSLKALAKELNIPVIALAQLNRAVETRTDKRPQLSDLRESGSIEQDADVVLFLNRPEYYGITTDTEGNSTEGIAEVIVGKQRNGPTDTAKMRFIKEYARFENLDLIHRDYPVAQIEEHSDEDLPI